MKQIIWEVKIISPPPAVRHCKKCGRKTAFYSSGAFRVNAQRKSLDIWLIYKCEECDSTWNMTIASRVNPASVDIALLEKFHGNDQELAFHYAMDLGLIGKNGADAGIPVYKIEGEVLEPDKLMEPVRLRICCFYPLGLKLSQVMREKLGISKRMLEFMLEQGQLSCEGAADFSKCRLQKEIVVNINCPL